MKIMNEFDDPLQNLRSFFLVGGGVKEESTSSIFFSATAKDSSTENELEKR